MFCALLIVLGSYWQDNMKGSMIELQLTTCEAQLDTCKEQREWLIDRQIEDAGDKHAH